MTKTSHSLQGIYAPLPQSLSDSDSEKEISMEPIISNNHSSKNFELRNGHNIQENDNNVKIKRGLSKMSPLRKAAFVFSMFMCFLPVILFLWVLPCTEFVTCPVKVTNWEYQQDDIELKGPINLVRGLYKSNLNLALLFKGSYNSRAFLKYGVMSFMGNNGIVAWDFQQEVEPLAINCSKIDVDGNGNFECLVVDRKGLKAIETVSGQALWHVRSADEKTISELEMPVTLPDFNKDGVSELLSIFKKESFLLICGRSGKALSNIKPPINCDTLADLKLYKKEIRYSCQNASRNISSNYALPIIHLKKFYRNSKFKMTATKENEISNNNIYTIGDRKLVVNNGVNCPHCLSSITLYNNEVMMKTWPYNDAFIMNPVPFSFQPSTENLASLRGHVNGFIVKIWQWKDHYTKIRPTIKVFKRSVASHGNETIFVSEVVERVVLITFNETDVHVINASLSDIKQICYTKDESRCQPDFRNQMDSYLIADLDWDGCHELISYYSTYINRNDDWHLVSYLKVFRLEKELPKLYGAK